MSYSVWQYKIYKNNILLQNKQLLNEAKYSAYLLEVKKVNNTKYIQ